MNRIRYTSLCVLVTLLVSSNTFAGGPLMPGQPSTRVATYVPDRVVIKLKSSVMNSTVGRLQAQVTSPNVALGIPSFDGVSAQVGAVGISKQFMPAADAGEASRLGIDRFVIVRLGPGSDVDAAIQAYASDPSVEYAGPDYIAHPAVVPTDPGYADNWGHNNYGQLPSWDKNTHSHFGPLVGDVGFDARAELGWDGSAGFGDPNVIIGIVDSGVDYGHPDLTTVPGFDFGDWDNDPADDSGGAGHGTACAGIAAAKANNGIGSCGSAPGCSIMPLKVCDSSGAISLSAVAVALVWGADHGVDVFSLSLGATIASDPGIDAGIEYARTSGAVILAAAGNSNSYPLLYPAINRHVIAVGAAAPCEGRKRSSSDEDEAWPNDPDPNGVTCDGEYFWGSNFGVGFPDIYGSLDILAPTILISTDIHGPGGWGPGDYFWYFNGTSCATPYAAGVCALIKSKYPDMSPDDIRWQLVSTARDVVNVESGVGWDSYSGYGLVNMARAVGCADPPIMNGGTITRKGDMSECVTVTADEATASAHDPNGQLDIVSRVITHVDGVSVGSQASVSVCGNGSHVVTAMVTDACGNAVSADVAVEIVNSAPVVFVKRRIADADDNCCIVVHVGDIDGGSYDPDGEDDIKSLCITDVDGTAVTCADSVMVCGVGEHTVSLTITDLSDVTSTATTTVTIGDNMPPVIEVTMDRDALWPPNHKLVTCCAEIVATDNCDSDVAVELVSITSSEPDNDKGDGNVGGDIQGADYGTNDTCFDLRSERAGSNGGRCYTIVYSATDEAGNVAYDTAQVCVPHDQPSSAVSSTGFMPEGAALEPNTESFALFIPGSSTLEVRHIDTKNIYVGNTAGVIRARETRRLDINGDNKLDLAVIFEVSGPDASSLVRGVPDAAVFPSDDRMDARTITDGPVGLHFRTLNGASYLVRNIYALGAPVEMPEGKQPVIPEPRELSTALSSEVRVTALTSIQPNPFNPQTTVNFSLANSERVRIAIYAVTGALVRNLVDETMAAGQHQARWDGLTNAGHTATSGIYFVRMIAGSYSEVRKIVMLK